MWLGRRHPLSPCPACGSLSYSSQLWVIRVRDCRAQGPRLALLCGDLSVGPALTTAPWLGCWVPVTPVTVPEQCRRQLHGLRVCCWQLDDSVSALSARALGKSPEETWWRGVA